ncbi:MAG: phospholipase D-like domain-containing protein [Candidatus Gracilibacteria bacterium]|nr:phospholipase D-like domain-containing protein [Candidatus Gracilibacteria bacterium]
MNIKKFLLFLFPLFLLVSCSNEYFDFHLKNQIFEQKSANLKQELEVFSAEKVQEKQLEFYSTPDKNVLTKLTDLIDKAKKRVYLEVYILTEKEIIKSLKNARTRGIDVQIILEKNVYGAGNINKKAFDSLTASGVNVYYANNDNYVFTHSKFFVLDDKYVISTGNMSYSTFIYNREFLLLGSDKENLDVILNIFDSDKKGEKKIVSNNSLVISPFDSFSKITTILGSAKKSIWIYDETFSDETLKNLLAEKKKTGIEIKILIGDSKKITSNKEDIEFFKKNGIEIKYPQKPFVHAKAFLVDNDVMYIGSINFTTNSMKNNRELGIIFRNKNINNDFIDIFNQDFQ